MGGNEGVGSQWILGESREVWIVWVRKATWRVLTALKWGGEHG